MKCLPLVAAFAALVPSSVYAQNQQSSDCHSLAVTENFIGPDEALVNGLVCKVNKTKTNSPVSTQVAGKPRERSMALLGIIEPETLRSKEEAGAASASTAEAAPGYTAATSTQGGVPPSSFFESVPEKSLGEIARAYRMKAAAQTTTQTQGGLARKKPEDVARVATPSPKTLTSPTVAEIQPAASAQVPAPAASPASAVKTEILTAAPLTIPPSPAETQRTAKNQVITVPPALPNALSKETSPATADPLHESPVKLETNSPAKVVTTVVAPEVQALPQTEILASASPAPAKDETAANLEPTATEAPQPEPSTGVGVFTVSRPPDVNPSLQALTDTTAADIAFDEGQVSTCIKNVSLGSIDKERLFLAIPEWALKWQEKNQKRFPGICFSDSLMPGARNYLVVFYYMATPQVAGAPLAKISALVEPTPAKGVGSFTTNYGSTWHYTYEGTVTTTITSVSAEKAPHNQPATLLYVTAYSQQGIPIARHWPASPVSIAKPIEKPAAKPGKSHDAPPPEFRGLEELLNQTLADIAKL